MNLPDKFEPRGDHIAIELRDAHVVFTTRRGGFSAGPYSSLNLGRLTTDDPANVARNRAALEQDLGVRLRFTRQVHGNGIRMIDSAEPDQTLPEADGQATALARVAPTALVADCVPIALAAEGAVGVVHAGWRGLATGVIEQGVRAVRAAGGRGALEAAVGPGAGPCCYEVGEEVHAVFAERFGGARTGRKLDLKLIARSQLHRAGVDTVHDLGLCTICSGEQLFYSHRRDRGVTGRQAGIAWLG